MSRIKILFRIYLNKKWKEIKEFKQIASVFKWVCAGEVMVKYGLDSFTLTGNFDKNCLIGSSGFVVMKCLLRYNCALL